MTSQCYNVAGIPRLELEACSNDDMLLIVEAFQAVRGTGMLIGSEGLHETRVLHGSERQSCHYQKGDCLEATTTASRKELNEICVGRSRCSVNVNVGWMRHCNAYSNYNFVLYQCIPSTCINIAFLYECVTSKCINIALLYQCVTSKCINIALLYECVTSKCINPALCSIM